MALIRSFIAIEPSETICQKIVALQQSLQQQMPELRIAPPQNLHLTLNFLGDQSAEQLAKIGQHMISLANSHSPFSLVLNGLGCFPKLKYPRVVWLGVQPSEHLMTLQKILSSELYSLGCLDEIKSYRPHLTLGRFRRPPANTETLRTLQNIDIGPTPVDAIVLYRSRLTPQGAVHQPLTVAELRTS